MSFRAVRRIQPLLCKNIKRGVCSKRGIPIRHRWWSHPSEAFPRGHEPFWSHWPFADKEFSRMFEGLMRPWHADTYYVRPRWRDVAEGTPRSEVAQVKYDNEHFEVKLDVQNFTPDELDVKLVGNRLSVGGKHEKKTDEHGYVAREFQREFEIPEDVDLETFKSSLSEDGFLTVRANILEPEKPPEKTIEINIEKSKS